jgi:hypothetical protein
MSPLCVSKWLITTGISMAVAVLLLNWVHFQIVSLELLLGI